MGNTEWSSGASLEGIGAAEGTTATGMRGARRTASGTIIIHSGAASTGATGNARATRRIGVHAELFHAMQSSRERSLRGPVL
jgi:hypothetical protein